MANPYVGEVGISYEGRDYTFRPSFFAISQLSNDPKEILQYFYMVQQQPLTLHDSCYLLAVNILRTLYSGKDDISDLVGYMSDDNGSMAYIEGSVPPQDVMTLARELMARGVSGVHVTGRQVGKTLRLFDPAKYVTDAVVHLGMQHDAAWNMTMIELQLALEAKFGKAKQEITPEQLAGYKAAFNKEKVKNV